MPLFSVVLIARNESKTLPRLVESLAEFQKRGGEIILVDTGSTDGTPQIARDLLCRVFEEGDRFTHVITPQTAYDINERFVVGKESPIVEGGDRMFDYANARNYAASLASNDVVAMPDCDEIYTKLDIDAINTAIAAGVQQLEYNFVYSHDELGRPLVQFLHCKFYDRRQLSWVGIVHEVLAGTAARLFFPENVIKLEHWQNPETNRGGYLKGLALDVIHNPENDRNAHYFGRELLYKGRPRSAIKQLRLHVGMNKWAEERSQSLIHIGEAYMTIGEVPEAIHAWIDAFDTCPTRREPIMKIAEYYRGVGSPDHLLAYISMALRIPGGAFYANFQPYYEDVPYELRFWALEQKDELPMISIVVPSLRVAGREKLMQSIAALQYPAHKIETIVLHDEPQIGVPKRVKEGVEAAKGEWIVYAADDMEFDPACLSRALQAAWRYNTEFVAFNAGDVVPDEGNICEHFMIHRLMIDRIGEIFDTGFYHVGVDNLLWAKMKKAGHAIRCERAIVRHHHFSRDGAMDDVYAIGWEPERVAHDRALLERKLAEL